MPPATSTTCPVTWPETRSDASTATCQATSSAVASLRSAIVRVTRGTRVGSARAERVIGVTVQPGQTALTRPAGAAWTISFFSERVRPYTMAALAAA